MQLLQYSLKLLCNSPRRWFPVSAETDGHSATNRALTLSQHEVQLCTLDRTAVYSDTAFAGGIGGSLISFHFSLILGYARHPFVQGVHHFYSGKQRPAPFQTSTRFELKHSCESCHWVLQGQDRKPVEAAALTAPRWCSFSSTGANQYETFCRPAQCQPSHTSTCAASPDLLGFIHGRNNQNRVLFLHFRIQRISNDSAKTWF